MEIYKHKQIGTLILVLVGVPLLLLVGVFAGAYSSEAAPTFALLICVLSLVLFLFHSLSTEVTRNELRVFFGLGLIQRRFQMDRIQGASQVQNRWYYGWGIRLTPSGWMWNVSGSKAVELELASGKKFRIGTDDPKGLLRAIERART